MLASLSSEQAVYIDQAVAIVDEGHRRGIPLRLLGSTAVLLSCPGQADLFHAIARPLTDVDLIALERYRAQVERMMRHLGYRVRGGRGVTMDVFVGRDIFVHDDPGHPHVDVFYDKLDFCHAIDFRDRFDAASPYTILPSDLLLEKMQIVEINEKDLKDTVVLLLEQDLVPDEPAGIGLKRIGTLLSDDWGFYYSVTTNLRKVKQYAESLELLTGPQRERIARQVDTLLEWIDSRPRSVRWKLRARVGTKVRWYAEVGEGYREIGGAPES